MIALAVVALVLAVFTLAVWAWEGWTERRRLRRLERRLDRAAMTGWRREHDTLAHLTEDHR